MIMGVLFCREVTGESVKGELLVPNKQEGFQQLGNVVDLHLPRKVSN